MRRAIAFAAVDGGESGADEEPGKMIDSRVLFILCRYSRLMSETRWSSASAAARLSVIAFPVSTPSRGSPSRRRSSAAFPVT
ncbi:MAG: hypothetical protein L0Z54_05755 [Thermoplasmata archaeon]|nr:hypothetical protein [Thermoplasmata archaeon]